MATIKEQEEIRELYLNPAQRQAFLISANIIVAIAGRRTGKTHGIASVRIYELVRLMPRCAIGVVGTSYQQILTRTMPGTIKGLEALGFVRDVHFVINRKPEKELNYGKPLDEPVSYANTLTFWNGTILRFISQEKMGSSNSMTLDALIVDEAKFINAQKLKDETIPAMGGFRPDFEDCHLYQSILIISDYGTTKKQNWFVTYEDHCDEELIKFIEYLVWKLEKAYKNIREKGESKHRLRTVRELEDHLRVCRRKAVLFREYSSIENIALVGEDYIKNMKRDLTPLTFRTSVLCQRLKKVEGGFYSDIGGDFYYSEYDEDHLRSLEMNQEAMDNLDCRQDSDIDPNQPLCIGFDYGKNINWLVVGQKHFNTKKRRYEMRVLKSFFVKNPKKLPDLVREFCNYYRFHKTQEVVFYYDSTALNGAYAIDDHTFASVIMREFADCRWALHDKYMGRQKGYEQRYNMLSQAFRGEGEYLTPMFNRHNNEDLIIALELAGLRYGSRGLEKDKAGEKLEESEEDLLEHRTDGTDAFDYLFVGMNEYPYDSNDYEHMQKAGLF